MRDGNVLNSVKQNLGMAEDYTAFDNQLIDAINTSLSVLRQLGVGPERGYYLNDSSMNWSEIIGGDEDRLELVKSYVFGKVRLLFDPPQSSIVKAAIDENLKELEWRILLVTDTNT